MTMSASGRVHLLGDHRDPKPTKAQQLDAAAEAIVEKARAETIKICEFYLAQLPDLVARMIGKAFEANGLKLAPPPNADMPAEPGDVQ